MDLNFLNNRIAELEKENAQLRAAAYTAPKGNSVHVPPEMKPVFDMAEETVNKYFQNLRMDSTKGTIEINDQRYILIRASALSKDFLDTIQKLYPDKGEHEALAIGKNFLFDIAHVIGMNDAKNFHARMNLVDPISKLSAGPVLFAHTGWAFVDISGESVPTPDDNFYLLYNHPYSFEADSWVRSGKKSDTPICIMNSGYSSGWCEQSFGIPLTSVEISCIAKGDEQCTFIMSPPHKVQEHLERFHAKNSNKWKKQEAYDIPTFFDRKRVEEEIQKSKTLAEASAKSKADFAANISHELRTPLSTILGFSDLLRKTEMNEKQKDYVEAINTSSRSLLSIINNILDLSKIDAGKLIVEELPFNISELMQSVQVMFSKKAKARGLKLNFLIDSTIDFNIAGDPMRLTQILLNLIGNAIKFTEKGKVEVSCVVEEQDDTSVGLGFAIRDTGIGIPAEKIDSIFERFTQADSNTTRRYGGTGLGLSITKQLIELLGGSIQVSSQPGVSTEFYFKLSFPKSSLQSYRHAGNEPLQTFTQGSGKKILIVEDTLLNQKLTSIILQNNHFEIAIAANGIEALNILKQQIFDLILMDIQMPEMDGYEATCIIRDELKIRTPIIAMTAHALSGEKEKCFQQGINDYLPKPFTESDLLFKISNLIEAESIIDLTYLKKQTKNNAAVIEEMIQYFRKENPRDMEKIKSAIEELNYQQIYKTVHSLKTETSIFGLRALIGDDLSEMETNARANSNMEEITKRFIHVRSVCEKAVQELATITL